MNAARILDHTRKAGCRNVVDYALELEDILEAIVQTDRDHENHELHTALMRARDLVDGWETP